MQSSYFWVLQVHLTPDSSPELTKKSWFGSLMTTEKDETFTVLVKGKPLANVKADLIHAFLSVSLNRFGPTIRLLASSRSIFKISTSKESLQQSLIFHVHPKFHRLFILQVVSEKKLFLATNIFLFFIFRFFFYFSNYSNEIIIGLGVEFYKFFQRNTTPSCSAGTKNFMFFRIWSNWRIE